MVTGVLGVDKAQPISSLASRQSNLPSQTLDRGTQPSMYRHRKSLLAQCSTSVNKTLRQYHNLSNATIDFDFYFF